MIFKKYTLPTISLCILTIFFPAAVFANTAANTAITGGELSLSGFPTSISMNPITIDGENWRISSGNVPSLVVTDGRGTGEGWKLSVSASQVTEIGGLGLTLPVGSVVLHAPVWVSPAYLDTTPTIETGQGTIDASPFTFARAIEGKGLGTYNIDFDPSALGIHISPTSKVIDKEYYPNSPTPYQTTLTWTLSNTP